MAAKTNMDPPRPSAAGSEMTGNTAVTMPVAAHSTTLPTPIPAARTRSGNTSAIITQTTAPQPSS
jgi:hypothetical protein